MAAKLIVAQALDFDGNILSGAKLDVYEAGTTTRRAIYTTSALSVESTNPAVATSDGAIAVWIDDTAGDYKAVLKNSAQTVTYYSQDDIDPTQGNLLVYPLGADTNGVSSVNGNTGVVVLDAEDVGAPAIGQTIFEAANAGAVQSALSLVPGSDVQAHDADLDAIAALAKTDGNIIVGNGSTWVAESGGTALTSLGASTIGSTIFTAANEGAVRTALSLVPGTDVLAYDANLQAFVTAFTLPESDGTDGQVLTTDGAGGIAWEDAAGGGGDLVSTNNLSDLDDVATAQQNLDLEPGVDVQSWTKGFVNVADYGVDLTGTTKDTTGVTNALAALVSQGGGVLYFPPGTYKRDDELTITNSNIHVVHAPGATIDCSNLAYTAGTRNSGCAISFEGTQAASTTLASSAALGATSITVSSATGIAVGQFVFLSSTKLLYDAGGLDAQYTDANRVVGVSGTTITLEKPLHLAFSVSGETVTAVFYTPLENVSVSGGAFDGGGVTASLANGLGRTCIHAIGCRDIRVSDLKISEFQGTGFWVEYFDIVRCEGCNFEGVPYGTSITEGQNSGFYGFYAVRGRDARASGLTGVRVRHLCDGVDVQEYIQSESKCYNSHRAAFGSHESVHGLEVTSCKAYNCYAGGVARAFTSKWLGNEFLQCTTGGFTTNTEVTGDEAGRLEMIGNTITVTDNVSTSAAAVSISGYYSPLIIKSNDFQSEGSRVLLISNKNLVDASIDGNRLETTYSTSSICLRIEAADETMNNVSVTDNDCIGYTLNGIRFNGSEDITAPADRVILEDNRGYAGGNSGNFIFLVGDDCWWGDNIIIRNNWQNNDASLCVLVDTSPVGRFMSHPIVENNVEYVPANGVSNRPIFTVGYNTSATLSGDTTVNVGARIENNQPSGTDPIWWVCTVPGTEGSIASVTAAATASSDSVTLTGNDGVKVYPGCWLSISGIGPAAAALTCRVTAMSSDYATITISTAASTTASGVAVARRNPTWVAGPQLQAT